jgi:hypothetical protein
MSGGKGAETASLEDLWGFVSLPFNVGPVRFSVDNDRTFPTYVRLSSEQLRTQTKAELPIMAIYQLMHQAYTQ